MRFYTVPCKIADVAEWKRQWDASRVLALRRYLGLSQRGLAQTLGVRQQTISEWETGLYRPRGASTRLLTIVAERAGFAYETGDTRQETGGGEP